MESLWQATAQMPEFPALEGDARTDVLIVGGGMAGVLCAYLLEEAGVDYLLLEANRIGSGVTGRTTAKLTAQHGLFAHRLLRRLGPERARLYLEANLAALARCRALCREIDCDFSPQDAYVYARKDLRPLEQEAEALARLGFPAEMTRETGLPFPAAGALRFPDQGQFHPLRFLAGAAAGLRVREHTKVLELAPGRARTHRGTVRAERIIVATHFPVLNKHGGYFLRLYQQRSYVLALEHAAPVDGMYWGAERDGLSFRMAGDLLLLGGGGHRTGKKSRGWAPLEDFARAQYPQARPRYRWATQDCMTLDGAPYIGPYSRRTPELLVATGFGKWGMTSSMAAAMVLTDCILGRESPYAPAFDPGRSSLRPQLAVNALESLAGLLTPRGPRCPHMGCALHWNPHEHSWDCACHGSRFAPDGRRLCGPATDDRAPLGEGYPTSRRT